VKTTAILLAVAALATLVALASPFTAIAASGPDFDAVISAVEQRYDAHAERVPMMGFVNFCAWFATGGGVHGMKIAEFDHIGHAPDSAELEKLVGESLGSSWERFIVDRQHNGEVNVIYVQPSGSAMRMLIADYEHGELDVVRIEVNAARLRHWIRDPRGSVDRHDYGPGDRGPAD